MNQPQMLPNEIEYVISSFKLPDVLKDEISMYSRKTLSKEMKSEITKKSRKLKIEASNRKLLDNFIIDLDIDINHNKYPTGLKYLRLVKKESRRISQKLNVRHEKKFVLGLHDIVYPHPDIFKFIEHNWKNVSNYVSNRKPPNEYVKHFIDIVYEQIPRKFDFRAFVYAANVYLDLLNRFDSPIDFD